MAAQIVNTNGLWIAVEGCVGQAYNKSYLRLTMIPGPWHAERHLLVGREDLSSQWLARD